MSASLVLTVRSLDPVPTFHGRGDDGLPEWPPSPLRVYQALVAAAAARWMAGSFRDYAEPALRWLERQPPPVVVAPAAAPGHPFRTAVPNNDMDRVARAWSAGNYSNTGDANPATHRSLKTVQPTRLLGGNAVRYVYVLADADPDFERVRESLFATTRAVTHVGWGVDAATMTAEVVTGEVTTGESEYDWRPVSTGGVPLRVPDFGTLDALGARHRDFLARAARPGVVDAGTPFTTFRVVGYHSPIASDAAPAPRAVAAFELRTPDLARFQPYDTARRTAAVAGMVRNATDPLARATEAFGWSDAQRLAAVHGHSPDGGPLRGNGADERFAFLPLPSIEARPALSRWVRGHWQHGSWVEMRFPPPLAVRKLSQYVEMRRFRHIAGPPLPNSQIDRSQVRVESVGKTELASRTVLHDVVVEAELKPFEWEGYAAGGGAFSSTSSSRPN